MPPSNTTTRSPTAARKSRCGTSERSPPSVPAVAPRLASRLLRRHRSGSLGRSRWITAHDSGGGWASGDRQVALQLPPGDLDAVVLPLLALEVDIAREDVVAE